MTTFLLIRHGTNDTVGVSIAGRAAGVHLNEEGKQQAQSLVHRLNSIQADAIYSSPLERTQETAQPYAESLGLNIELTDDFLEVDFGEWTGKSIELLDTIPLFKTFNIFRSSTRIPGGEMMHEAQARMITGLSKLRDKHKDGVVSIFSHGDMIKAAIAYYAGIPLDLFNRIEISPASVSIIQVDEYQSRIIVVNHTGDLQLN